MLVLFETPAGYAVFKMLDEGKLQKSDDLYKDFETPEAASKVVKLKHFSKFEDMTAALSAATAAVEGKMGKGLKKMLKKVFSSDVQDTLAVADAKLGGVIKDKLNISCVHSSAVHELFRGIRNQMANLITGLPQSELDNMALGLSHSLSRYKLKFSPDKVDTMIIQAIALLDDLDKELNNYSMRSREWYGWHFPELGKIVPDNLTYAKTVKAIGIRGQMELRDLTTVLPEEVEEEVRAAAEVSMGTEISEEDRINILHLCDQVIEISEYRAQLYDYLRNRMLAIAPNLTLMVGELVGARLIAHAGSLLNLAKHPSSTVQILGAEKALFRALKTKHDTPKYGLIYHASLVGQSAPKNKGKISRMLAAKASLCVRVDALGEEEEPTIGLQSRALVEQRLRECEQTKLRRISGAGKSVGKPVKHEAGTTPTQYNTGPDFTLSQGRKRKREEASEEEKDEEPVKKVKKRKSTEGLKAVKVKAEVEEETPKKKKKSKRIKTED
ncbi:nucleolar protein 58-like [Halichondria panicea]|uniref:nucleolar protein 58-like n=1 Tax=Halichondria panicea TaxID=6063 RepID=UPI00312BB104